MLIRRRTVTGTLIFVSIFWSTLGSSQGCENSGLNSPALFITKKEYGGQIAWLPSGPDSSSIWILNKCADVDVARRPVLYFTISNAIDPHSSSETETFVFVQVTRFQKEQQGDRLSLDRNSGWLRKMEDGTVNSLSVIDNQPLKNISIDEFISIHEKMTVDLPGDDKIRIENMFWHGRPTGGIYSSFEVGKAIASEPLPSNVGNFKTTTSNRLLKFKFNTGGEIGVPFRVKTEGTEMIIIKTFSPNRSDFVHSVTINLKK
ncbi:MAG: hypothetical protein QOF19_1735 [Alphaproteobacteria bacterium]|jgi:hypothetical protein|nr:hypothetical protein [Alphaproteobacteria bacterium]